MSKKPNTLPLFHDNTKSYAHHYVYDNENIIAILDLHQNKQHLATIVHHPTRTDTPLSITNHETQRTYYYHRDEKRIADNNSLLSVASEPKRSERSVAVEEGSIVALTNSEGKEVENITYDGHYGKILKHTKEEETLNPYGYTGRETDQEDLYYYRARYYDPTTQRFLSRDPIELEAGDFNFYRYVSNDPVNFVDPSGLYVGVDDAIFAGGGAVIGVIGQGVSDLWSWELSGWEDYAGSAVGGAAFGEALLYTGPIGAGAAGSFATNITKQVLKNETGKQCGYDITSLAVDTALGGATGVIPGMKIPGITAGKGSMNAIYNQMTTKLKNGQISTVTAKTASKMFAGRATQTAVAEGVVIGGGIGSYGSPKVPTYGDMEIQPGCGCP
ncbi:MAG: RHS repeat-associated core domain-containing protein [Sulfurovum sp.]|nr:RHS repeat-associated core domain-containing protein [Sulfurovum sp.]